MVEKSRHFTASLLVIRTCYHLSFIVLLFSCAIHIHVDRYMEFQLHFHCFVVFFINILILCLSLILHSSFSFHTYLM